LADRLGRDEFDSFFSFAIVRNPWDWQVSLYTYALADSRHRLHDFVKGLGSFDRYIHWRCDRVRTCQRDFVFSKEGEQLVNFLGRYENLQQDFDYICSRVGVSAPLPRLNASSRKPYQQYYDRVTADLVRKAFEPDIALFGYDF
jgi:hypothetical protein